MQKYIKFFFFPHLYKLLLCNILHHRLLTQRADAKPHFEKQKQCWFLWQENEYYIPSWFRIDHKCTNPYSMNKCLKGLLKSWNYSNKEEKLLEDKMHEWFSDHNIILPLKTFNALAAVSSTHMRWSKITFVGSHRLRNGLEIFVGLFFHFQTDSLF